MIAAAASEPLEEICPQTFALPAAPTVAAASEGRAVEMEPIREAFTRLSERHDWVVAEGAGGLLVPATRDLSMADLSRELELPLLIACRAALGTINHTLLTLEAAEARSLPVAGVVISHSDGVLSDADRSNLEALREALGATLVGEIPPLGDGELPADDSIDLAALLDRAGELAPATRPNG